MQILGLEANFTQAELRKRYRSKAQQQHPDQCKLDTPEVCQRAFVELAAAYEALREKPQKPSDAWRAFENRRSTAHERDERHQRERAARLQALFEQNEAETKKRVAEAEARNAEEHRKVQENHSKWVAEQNDFWNRRKERQERMKRREEERKAREAREAERDLQHERELREALEAEPEQGTEARDADIQSADSDLDLDAEQNGSEAFGMEDALRTWSDFVDDEEEEPDSEL